ncbi:MAG: YfhO family protein, partial [Chloroflexota bacterium]|nr:YfhO family protein [Chloroflexota bacterium]
TNQPDRLRLDVQSSTQAMVVVSELYYPGWRATVDGTETPIYRADHALRAVMVPAGRHSVEMVFNPLSFRMGAVISLATIVAAALVLLHAAWRARW